MDESALAEPPLGVAQAESKPKEVSASQAIVLLRVDIRGDRMEGLGWFRNMGERRFWERKSPTQTPVLVPGPEDRGAVVLSQARPFDSLTQDQLIRHPANGLHPLYVRRSHQRG